MLNRLKRHFQRSDRIQLYPDWDSFPTYEFNNEKHSYYAGRHDQVNRLAHWIVDGTGGSVLVSGVRGVGKTAFVYHAINHSQKLYAVPGFFRRIKDWLYRWSLVTRFIGTILDGVLHLFFTLFLRWRAIDPVTVVTVNAALVHFDGCSGTSRTDLDTFRLSVIKQLICSLRFSAISNKKIMGQVSDLYTWSLGKSQEDTKDIKELKASILLNAEILRSATKLFPYSTLFTTLYGVIIYFGNGLQYFMPQAWIERNVPDYILLVLVLISFILSLFTLSYSKSSEVTRIVNFTSENVDYLYARLNEILRNSQQTFVFVIDELDKIDRVSKLNHFIRAFKNLFTISSGRFIFITSEEYYFNKSLKTTIDASGIEVDSDDGLHGESSTYFGWEVLLSYSTVVDLIEYISKISVDKQDRHIDHTKELAYSLYFETSGLFVEIMREMRQFISYANGRHGLTVLKQIPYLTLPEDMSSLKRKARLGKIIENVLNQNISNYSQRSNFEFVKRDVLHMVVRKLLEVKDMQIASSNPKPKLQFYAFFEDLFVKSKLSYDEKIEVKHKIDDLLHDLNNLAHNSGDGTTLGWVIPEDVNENITAALDLSQVTEGIDDLPSSRIALTTTENRLCRTFDRLNSLVEHWSQAVGRQYGTLKSEFIEVINLGYGVTYKQLGALVENIRTEEASAKSTGRRVKLFNQVELQAQQESAQSIINSLSSYNMVLARYCKQLFPEIEIEESNNTVILKRGYRQYILINGQIVAGNIRRSRHSNSKISYLTTEHIIDSNRSMHILNLIRLIREHLHLTISRGKLKEWNIDSGSGPSSVIGDKVFVIDFVNEIQQFLKLSCNLISGSNHWRFGLAFGYKKDEKDRNYSVFHLYKNENDDNIQYRKIWNSRVSRDLSEKALKGEFGIIEDGNANQQIGLEVRRKSKTSELIEVLINGTSRTSMRIPRDDFQSLALLAWGDGQEFAINATDINIEMTLKI